MEELIDVLDENGKTGEILPRSEVHKNGLWHRIIGYCYYRIIR